QALDHGPVLERADVARQLLARGDAAQQAAHDLARARLGQGVGEADLLGPGDRADLLHDVPLELLAQRVRRLHALLERDERDDGLALHLVGTAHHRGLGDLRVRHQRRLDLHRPHAWAGPAHHVLYADTEHDVVWNHRI